MTPFLGRGFLIPSASHLLVATSTYRRPAFGLLARQDSTVAVDVVVGRFCRLEALSWRLPTHSVRLRLDFRKTADP